MNRPGYPRRLGWLLLLVSLLVGQVGPASAQQSANEQLNKVLAETEAAAKTKEERQRPPIEFFRSQLLPNDVLPYAKANHWAMMSFELRSNHADYEGVLQSTPVPLLDQPQQVSFKRDARLVKGQRSRINLPLFLPSIPKELVFQLMRPEAIREDEAWAAPFRVLEPHQMLIPVLTKNPNDTYSRWNQFRAVFPSSGTKSEPVTYERQRYYRLVLPLELDKPLLPGHPLAWTPISHVIWDGFDPALLNIGQQQAMLDWLHFGGQLVISGGAGPVYGPLRESFLAPFLPADATAENRLYEAKDLEGLAQAYAPPTGTFEPDDANPEFPTAKAAWEVMGRRYRDPEPFRTTAGKPIYMAGLTPRQGATAIAVGASQGKDTPIAVEWRVGRGRVIMLAVSLADPDFGGWAGFETFVRRVVLRRPEEVQTDGISRDPSAGGGFRPSKYAFLNGRDLTTLRYVSRDLAAQDRKIEVDDSTAAPTPTIPGQNVFQPLLFPGRKQPQIRTETPVCEWIDSGGLPDLSRKVLAEASGIEIPSSRFVLKVIVGYLIALVPLNWLICRYLFGRKEWAWVVVPILAIGFAVVVERAAAYDVGYDSACDEIDMVETYADYTRGHVSRFASLYSTGRVKYTISFPNDATGLALPFSTGRSIRGEDNTDSTFQTYPSPALSGYLVQPRSLALFRAEQLASLSGNAVLVEKDGKKFLVNNSGANLKDAVVVEMGKDRANRFAVLGDISSGAEAPLPAFADELADGALRGSRVPGTLDPLPFLEMIHGGSVADRPEEVGELRLIAWAEGVRSGQVVEPAVDRHRGFTLFVAHLKMPGLMPPSDARYNALAGGPEVPPKESQFPIPPPTGPSRFGRGGMRVISPGPGSTAPGMMPPGMAPAPPTPPATPSPTTPMPVPIPPQSRAAGKQETPRP